MTNINVSLPEPMRDWVEAQIKAGRYGNLSEYVRNLIRQDQDREAKEQRIDELLLEGIRSLEAGRGIEVTEENWDSFWAGVWERAQARRAKEPKAKSAGL